VINNLVLKLAAISTQSTSGMHSEVMEVNLENPRYGFCEEGSKLIISMRSFPKYEMV
jgi:hypothetical protein